MKFIKPQPRGGPGLIQGLARNADRLELPLVYSRDAVVFPHTLASVLAATRFAAVAVEKAAKADKRIICALLAGLGGDKEGRIEVHPIASLARIVQQVRLPDGSIRLLVEGQSRVRIKKTLFHDDHMSALVEPLCLDVKIQDDSEAAAAFRLVKRSFLQYAELVKKIPAETLHAVDTTSDPQELCDLVGNSLPLRSDKRQELFSVEDLLERLEATEAALEAETELVNLQRRIGAKVRNRMDRSQREYFLQEQLKEIHRELGKENEESEVKELERLLLERQPPEEVLVKAKKELARLSKLQSFSPEAGVLRSYCEWLSELPWSGKSLDNRDLGRARAVLDEEHYGLEKPKERILEFIAVRQLSDKARGPILCLVGPPGTGKTSLGRSVARALDRRFVRISLGGLRDEAEIRGHRKTYVGALPGRIIQSMKRAGSANPVFLLDEIDKMSSDFRGDPASALLEVLDPEQNANFTDHYLELPFDLSNVMFITTANSIHGIPYPLLDRMELIEVPGYSEYEKLAIAKRFILPRQIRESGLAGAALEFQDEAILEIIRHYTMESGVRNLERSIARIARKLAQDAVSKGICADSEELRAWSAQIDEHRVRDFLGKRLRDDDVLFREHFPGIAYGLAWTEAGGTLLPVEALVFSGEESLVLTGNLGDVMKESAKAALSFIRSHAADFRLSDADFVKKTVHVHVPEGAIPKDGPSAGVTLMASILSAFTGKSVEPGRAMTGEITLTGRVLPVGGIKEKVLAAHRNGIGTVILPEGNRGDLDELPAELRDALCFVTVSTVAQLLEVLFPSGAQKKAAAKKAPRKARPGAPRKSAKP